MITSLAQNSYTELSFENNDWYTPFALRVNSNGILGVDLEDLSPSSPLLNTNNHFLSQAGIWISAEDENGQIYTAVQHLKEVGQYDFWPGPVDTLTGQTDPVANWDYVWKLTTEDISYHRQNYREPTYQIPNSILNWPANGAQGFNEVLAPYIDANNNKVYDPENGDYPYIKGDEMTYTIFNDLVDEHKASNGQELGLELYQMAYLSNQQASPIVVLEYYIVSRSSKKYQNIRVGFFMEADTTLFKTPKVGTRTMDNDQGVARSVFMYDSEQAGGPMVLAQIPQMSSSIAFNNRHPFNKTPVNAQEYHNYLNGRWADSSVLTFGGNGNGGVTPSPYIFPNFEWTDTSSHASILGVRSYSELHKGEHIKLSATLAFMDSTWRDARQASLDWTLKNNQHRDWISSIKKPTTNIAPKLFPNPSHGQFTIESTSAIKKVQVMNLQGITIVNEEIKNILSWQCNELLNPGVYTVLVETQVGIKTKKLVIKP